MYTYTQMYLLKYMCIKLSVFAILHKIGERNSLPILAASSQKCCIGKVEEELGSECRSGILRVRLPLREELFS